MGIDISTEKVVSYNPAHERLVNTSIEGNPHISKTKGLHVQAMFRRKRSNRKDVPDGNPLIYALKRKKGYSIRTCDVKRLLVPFRAILEKCLKNKNADYVIPLPSSSSINLILAERIVRTLGGGSVVSTFQKKTVEQVIQELEVLEQSSLSPAQSKTRTALLSSLNSVDPSRLITMKDIGRHSARKLVSPLEYSGVPEALSGSLLIVDDLWASGATMISAYNHLKNMENITSISGLCLFSRL